MVTDRATLSSAAQSMAARTEERFKAHRDKIYRETDRVFAWLLGAEWVFGILMAIFFSPYGWSGKQKVIHMHIWLAIVLGGIVVSLPIALAILRPGQTPTRHVVAVGQMLMSALLIHLSGGRIETHFHVFGSLAFLSFYRDWPVLMTGTAVVVCDHLIRGLLFPESVYGIVNPEWWRFLEHAFWVVFCDIVLVMACARGVKEMRSVGEQIAQLEALADSQWRLSEPAQPPIEPVPSP